MLYVRLTLRNLKRSMKEYSIFMMTMIFSIMLMYAYHAVALSKEILALSRVMDQFLMLTLSVSIILVIILGWLVAYISNFMLKKRSKEFGMYLLMGMKRKQVTRMYVLEQLCMGFVAFVIGSILGLFLTQVIQMFIMHVFDAEYHFAITISPQALLLTFICFLGIYALELYRERRAVKKMNIHELLYKEHHNEAIKHKQFAFFYFFFAILATFVGLKQLQLYLLGMAKNSSEFGSIVFLSGCFLLVLSVYLYFIGLSSVLTGFFQRFKTLKYRGQTMFVFGALIGRLRTNRFVLATLSVLILLTLIFVSVGFKLKEVNDVSNKLYTPNDVVVMSGGNFDQKVITNYLSKQKTTYQDHQYNLYHFNDLSKVQESFQKAIINTNSYSAKEKTYYMKESDYQALLKLNGHKPAPALKANEYAMSVVSQFYDHFDAYLKKSKFLMDQKEMKLSYLSKEEIGIHAIFQYYVAILPDAAFENVSSMSTIYVANTTNKSEVFWKDDLQKEMNEIDGYAFVQVKAYFINQSLSSFTMIIFSLLYAALIFSCCVATIIATQQLSDSQIQKYSYKMLWKLGLSKRKIHGLLCKQSAIYFVIPMIIPLLYIYPIISSIQPMFTATFAPASIFIYFWPSLLFFLFIYLCYFVVTYYGSRRNIDS